MFTLDGLVFCYEKSADISRWLGDMLTIGEWSLFPWSQWRDLLTIMGMFLWPVAFLLTCSDVRKTLSSLGDLVFLLERRVIPRLFCKCFIYHCFASYFIEKDVKFVGIPWWLCGRQGVCKYPLMVVWIPNPLGVYRRHFSMIMQMFKCAMVGSLLIAALMLGRSLRWKA